MGLALPGLPGFVVEENLDELAELARSTGLSVVGRALQNRRAPDAKTFIGRGKAEEVGRAAEELGADVVIFDDDLTPNQVKNLEQVVSAAVIDRSALILDLFVRQARTREARTQVELAQLEYQLPRLTRRWTHLSRQVGGIGVRGGEGETQLEADRRMLRTRIKQLKKELGKIERTRALHRRARRGTSIVALAGYTNAGKSTLFNYLTDAGVLVEDQLFATLDSTVRRSELPNGRAVLFSDTVGFVRRLPHELVEAFRSTLEEVNQATLLLHVVDAADPNPDRQIDAVRRVLREIDAGTIPEQLVINKADIAEQSAIERLEALHPDALTVSAVTGAGVNAMLEALAELLEGAMIEIDLTIPYDRGDLVAALHEAGEVIGETHTAAGTELRVKVPKTEADRYAQFTGTG